MRIALAFFGLPRCSSVTWPSIQAHVIQRLAQAGEVRMFHHLYRQERVVNLRSGEDHALAASNYEPFAASTGIFEDFDSRVAQLPLEAFKPHGDAWRDDFMSMRNLLLQLHSLDTVTSELEGWQPDVVVFARPDMLYHDALPVEMVRLAAAEPLLVALPWWQWWTGLNDRFAICGRSIAPAYGHRMALAEEFCRQTRKALHAEQLLMFALKAHGTKLKPISLRASRIRVNGHMVEEGFAPSPFANKVLAAIRQQGQTDRPGP